MIIIEILLATILSVSKMCGVYVFILVCMILATSSLKPKTAKRVYRTFKNSKKLAGKTMKLIANSSKDTSSKEVKNKKVREQKA